MDRFQSYYHLHAGPSNVYDGHYSDADYYFINETAINASGTRPVHRLEMSLSKTIGGKVVSFYGSVKNLDSSSFNGFVLVFIVENGLVDSSYPTITWNSVFRDYGLNKTLSLAGSSTDAFNGSWTIPSGVNGSNVQVMAAAYDASTRDPTYGRPYAVQSVCATYGQAAHDISVLDVKTSKTVVGRGFMVDLNVTLQNQGSFPETFNVTIECNTTTINTQTVTLASGDTTIIAFAWNTTGFAEGNYTISAYAEPVPGETNTADNTLVDGWIVETILGDVTGDYKVDILDIASIAKAYGAYPGHPKWNPNADLDDNNKIDIIDIAKAAKNFGKTDP